MNKVRECPERSRLVEYLLGKLPVVEHETCEVHIAQCNDCEDTIRGLNVTDTLDDLACAAMAEATESNELKLVKKLVSDVRQISSGTQTKFDRLTLERSAEIVRLLSVSEDPEDIGRVGHYRITDLLGAGSTGVVYRAFDEQLDRVVALKIIRPSLGQTARSRFLIEAKTAAAVDHPNVVTIFQVGEENELAYMAMQLLPGETLESRLQRDVFLKEKLARDIAAQIADGLAAAHAKDLIHRDIKPANIWLDESDQVKILDFGLARIVDDDPGFTSTGMIAGTPCYMSPEQSKGMPLDGRSDLFSLGCIMYRASTGRQPFGSTNILSTLQAIQNSQPAPPVSSNAEVSQEVSDLTMCLLEKLPVNRPGSASSVADALRKQRSDWDFSIANYETSLVQNADAANSKVRIKSGAVETQSLAKQPRARTGMGWFGHVVTLVAFGFLGFGGFMFGSDIIRIMTGHGQLTIKTDDPDVKIELLEKGKVVRIIDTKTSKQIDIKEGKYSLQVAGEENSITIEPTNLTMTRGGKEIVKVTSSSNEVENSRASASLLSQNSDASRIAESGNPSSKDFWDFQTRADLFKERQPFQLPLDPKNLELLKAQGFITAKVRKGVRDDIDAIVLTDSDNAKNSTMKLKLASIDDGLLQFEVDDAVLENLKTTDYKFEIPQRWIGSIDLVAFLYRGKNVKPGSSILLSRANLERMGVVAKTGMEGPQGTLVAKPGSSDGAKSAASLANSQGAANKSLQLEKQVQKIADSLSSEEQKTSVELMDAKLALAEYEVELCVRSQPFNTRPADIARSHGTMKQYLNLLKTRLSSEFRKTKEDPALVQSLKTRKLLAQREVSKFETKHGLSSSEPRYNGIPLYDYLETVKIERNENKLTEAFQGIAKLSDQFDRREDYYELVRTAFERVVWTRNAQPVNGIFELVQKLESEELAELLVDAATSGNRNSQKSATMLVVLGQFNTVVERAIANDPDQFFERVLGNEIAWSDFHNFLSLAVAKAKPENEKLKRRLVKIFEPKFESGQSGIIAANQVEPFIIATLKLDPNRESLVKGVELASRSQALSIASEIPEGSDNAAAMVPFLVAQIVAAEQGVHRLGSSKVQTWEYAANVLAGYGDSVIDSLQEDSVREKLVAISRRRPVVSKMIQWRQADGKPHEKLDELLEMYEATEQLADKVEGAVSEAVQGVKGAEPASYMQAYRVSGDSERIYAVVSVLFEKEKAIRMMRDNKTNKIILKGQAHHHDKFLRILKCLESEKTIGVGESGEPTEVGSDLFLAVYKSTSHPTTTINVLESMLQEEIDRSKCRLVQLKPWHILCLGSKSHHKKVAKMLESLADEGGDDPEDASTAAIEYRSWTDSAGKFKFDAALAGVDEKGKAVVLQDRNGKRRIVPLEKLSKADRTWVQQWLDTESEVVDSKSETGKR